MLTNIWDTIIKQLMKVGIKMYKWEQMTREELRVLAEKDSLVVITIGAMEQHGPHLPVNTDNLIVNEIAKKSTKKAREAIPIVLGPNIPFGFSPHHFIYAGAISLSVQTLITLLKEVVQSVTKTGFTKIFILNSHGGNDESIKLAAKEMSFDLDALIGAASYWNLVGHSFDTLLTDHDIYSVGHAGQFETSLIMAIDQQFVRTKFLNEGKKGREIFDLTFPSVVKNKPENVWVQMDGYSDKPWKANAEIGESVLEYITDIIRDELITFYSET